MKEQIKIFVLRIDLNRIFKFWTDKKNQKKNEHIDLQSGPDIPVQPLEGQVTNGSIVQDSEGETTKEPNDI